MELQFDEPGWVPQFAGFGCSATKWCANLTIDSLSDQDNTGVQQNADCLENHFLVGEEPINWAYITKDGKSQAPANPLALSDDPNLTGLNPDLLIDPGDTIRIFMHDTPAGHRVDITDLTTGGHGSMTASVANGFGHVLFQPNATQCHVAPYAFHPMYDSAVPRGTTWGAHISNVAFSDEIGHFEYCDAIDPDTAACTDPGGGDRTLDADDQACLDGTQFNALIPIKGCVLDDGDLRRAVVSPRLAGHRHQRGPRPAGAPHTCALHGAGLGRQGARAHGVRDRPATHRAGRRAGQPAARVRPQHRRQLRQPASGRRVLPAVHVDARRRDLLPAAGRPEHPGHGQRLRRHVNGRVRRPAVRHLSRRRVQGDLAGGGLPPRPPRRSVRKGLID
jgi:hypothetical protein